MKLFYFLGNIIRIFETENKILTSLSKEYYNFYYEYKGLFDRIIKLLIKLIKHPN